MCPKNLNAIIPSSLAYSACLYEIIILRINQSNIPQSGTVSNSIHTSHRFPFGVTATSLCQFCSSKLKAISYINTYIYDYIYTYVYIHIEKT